MESSAGQHSHRSLRSFVGIPLSVCVQITDLRPRRECVPVPLQHLLLFFRLGFPLRIGELSDRVGVHLPSALIAMRRAGSASQPVTISL
jgi:hypothetical protein